MHVFSSICRHYIYAVPDAKMALPRRTCDDKIPYCNSCLAARNSAQSEGLAATLATLRLAQESPGPGVDTTKQCDGTVVDELLQRMSLEDDLDALVEAIAALQAEEEEEKLARGASIKSR